jgi:NAD(P)-dependent dehydrogenase (short-subunit alcohol dehydrogenase family)
MSPNHAAVVTGGASGIGLAAALRFAQLGMNVCIADLGSDRLAAAEAKLSAAAPAGSTSILVSSTDVSRPPLSRWHPDFAAFVKEGPN